MSAPTLKTIRKLTESPRYKLARKHHRCPEGYEGPCWGPTDVDYAWADEQLRAYNRKEPRDGE